MFPFQIIQVNNVGLIKIKVINLSIILTTWCHMLTWAIDKFYGQLNHPSIRQWTWQLAFNCFALTKYG